MKPYTVVITSCGRFDLLDRTLGSLQQHLEGPLDGVIVAEDSGNPDVQDVVRATFPDALVLLNRPQLGQLTSIDRAYSFVRTPFIFHCEDDWEFSSGSFLHPSAVLLEAFPELSLISLRARGELNRRLRNAPGRSYRGIPYFQADPALHPDYFGYSFNPGLRRTADYLRIGPFASFCGEREISYCFKKLGYTMGYLEDACVMHIGHDRHIDDPKMGRKARTTPQRLAHSARIRFDRLRRHALPWLDPAVQIQRGIGRFAASRLSPQVPLLRPSQFLPTSRDRGATGELQTGRQLTPDWMELSSADR
jgi:hypothetical protein